MNDFFSPLISSRTIAQVRCPLAGGCSMDFPKDAALTVLERGEIQVGRVTPCAPPRGLGMISLPLAESPERRSSFLRSRWNRAELRRSCGGAHGVTRPTVRRFVGSEFPHARYPQNGASDSPRASHQDALLGGLRCSVRYRPIAVTISPSTGPIFPRSAFQISERRTSGQHPPSPEIRLIRWSLGIAAYTAPPW